MNRGILSWLSIALGVTFSIVGAVLAFTDTCEPLAAVLVGLGSVATFVYWRVNLGLINDEYRTFDASCEEFE